MDEEVVVYTHPHTQGNTTQPLEKKKSCHCDNMDES